MNDKLVDLIRTQIQKQMNIKKGPKPPEDEKNK